MESCPATRKSHHLTEASGPHCFWRKSRRDEFLTLRRRIRIFHFGERSISGYEQCNDQGKWSDALVRSDSVPIGLHGEDRLTSVPFTLAPVVAELEFCGGLFQPNWTIGLKDRTIGQSFYTPDPNGVSREFPLCFSGAGPERTKLVLAALPRPERTPRRNPSPQKTNDETPSDKRGPRIFLIRPAFSLRHPERSEGPRTGNMKNSWPECNPIFLGGGASLRSARTLLRFRGHQPARKFSSRFPCEDHTKLCACFQAQRVAVGAIEQQSNGSPARRAGKYPAHLANSSPVVAGRKLQHHRRSLSVDSSSRPIGLSRRIVLIPAPRREDLVALVPALLISITRPATKATEAFR